MKQKRKAFEENEIQEMQKQSNNSHTIQRKREREEVSTPFIFFIKSVV
jgi:hypothetical protein